MRAKSGIQLASLVTLLVVKRSIAHSRILAFAALVSASWLQPAAADPPAPEPTMRERIEAAAKDLPFFDWGDFLYDRLDERSLPANTPTDLRDRYLSTLRGLLQPWRLARIEMRLSPSGTPVRDRSRDEEVAALLASADPRVRTLAMALLFDREEPRWLPLIAQRVGDEAETFAAPVNMHLTMERPYPPPRTERTTVGRIARAMISFWTGRSGKPGWSPTFEDWWRERKDRTWSMAWFSARLERAAHGSRFSVDTVLRGRQVAAWIHRLESPAREVSLLCLLGGDESGEWPVATDLDLMRAARRLGPDRCLAILRGDTLTDDPDEARYQHSARLYLLNHAPETLRASDRAALSSLARTAEGPLGHWYAAIAHLDPLRAGEAVDEGLAHMKGPYEGSERAHLLWEAWTILGRSRIPFVLDWLFRERDPNFGDYPYYPMTLLRRALDRWTADDRALVAAYVLDARLDAMQGRALQDFLEALETNLPEPAVPKGVRDRVRSYPANEKDPAVAAALVEWRKALRESVPRWAPKD